MPLNGWDRRAEQTQTGAEADRYERARTPSGEGIEDKDVPVAILSAAGVRGRRCAARFGGNMPKGWRNLLAMGQSTPR